jgi:uncharacterized protein YprB with RNaseH-like and TPR domain
MNINLNSYLFLDIETVPEYSCYENVPEQVKMLWDRKTVYQRKNNESAEDFYPRAGIWAEFGKIVCISCGIIDRSNNLRIKSFTGDEKNLLTSFSAMLEKFTSGKTGARLCAHNGKEFDFPFIARRMLINRLGLPAILNVQGAKPWEMPFVDTLELWKFGDAKHYCSLELLASIFGIPSPKDDIDGSMVAKIYYQDCDIARIAKYCEKDVITLTELFIRLTQSKRFDEVISVNSNESSEI